MSPKYTKWHYVPSDIQEMVKKYLRNTGKELGSFVNQGMAFTLTASPDRTIGQFIPPSDLTANQQADARKLHSAWHIVEGLGNKSKTNYFRNVTLWTEPTPEEQRKRVSSLRKSRKLLRK